MVHGQESDWSPCVFLLWHVRPTELVFAGLSRLARVGWGARLDLTRVCSVFASVTYDAAVFITDFISSTPVARRSWQALNNALTPTELADIVLATQSVLAIFVTRAWTCTSWIFNTKTISKTQFSWFAICIFSARVRFTGIRTVGAHKPDETAIFICKFLAFTPIAIRRKSTSFGEFYTDAFFEIAFCAAATGFCTTIFVADAFFGTLTCAASLWRFMAGSSNTSGSDTTTFGTICM